MEAAISRPVRVLTMVASEARRFCTLATSSDTTEPGGTGTPLNGGGWR